MNVSKMPDKMNGECKLKKLTVEDYALFKEKQEIVFSTDDKKITVILGQNGTGKTLLYNAIKVCFSLEISGNKIPSIPVIDTTFDQSLISNENEWLFFISENISHQMKIKNYGDYATHDIINKMNELYHKYDTKQDVDCFDVDKDHNIHAKNQNGQVVYLALSEQVLANLAYILAVKQVCAPKSFLVIDGGLMNISREKYKNIMNMITENTMQVILFCTDSEYQHVEKQSVGKEYIIKYNSENKCSEIKKTD